MAHIEVSKAVTVDDEVKHGADVKDGCQISNVDINKFSVYEGVVDSENKIHNTDYVRVKVEVDHDDYFSENCNVVVGTDDEAQKIETLLSLESQSLASGPYQCESVGLDDKFLSAETSLTETREEDRDQCKAETCQTEETGELDEGQSESTDETHESMEDKSKSANNIQQTKESAAIDKDTCYHAVESGEMEEDQFECAVAEMIKIEECEDVEEGHCENGETHETEESEVEGRHSVFVETNQVEDDMKGSDQVKVQSNEDEVVKQIDEVRDKDSDKDKQVDEVRHKINDKNEEIKHCDEVKNQNIQKNLNSKKRALHEIDSDLQTHSENSQSAACNALKRKRKISKMIERVCGEGQEREPSQPGINDSGRQMQLVESTTVGKAPCLLESSSHQSRLPAPSQWASNLRPSPNCGPVMETLQSGPGRPPKRQRTEPHMGPPMQLLGSYRPSIEPGPAMGPPRPDTGHSESGMGLPGLGMEPPVPGIGPLVPSLKPPVPGIGPPGPSMDLIEMGGSGRGSLGMSPQSQEMKKQPEVVEEKKVEPKPEQKPVNKPRPVASTPIPGTVWCVVRTDDGKCFFYDPSKRRSVWKRPEELKNRPDVDKLLATKPEVKTGKKVSTEKVEVRDLQEEPPLKKIRTEAEVKEVTEESNHEVTQQIVLGEDAASIPGVQASQHSSFVTVEERMKQFRDLLAEKNISATSTWMKEFHKIANDKRYLLLNIRERRQVFDEYVKDRAEDVHREQNRIVNAKNALFRQLLEECNLNAKSTFNDFLELGISDKRFSLIDSMKDRRSVFLAYISELAEQEKEKELMKEKAKNDFMKKLSEIPGINHSTTWSDIEKKVSADTSYDSLFSDSHKENWYQEYLKNLNDVKNDYMRSLSKIPGINNSTTWSYVKHKVTSDPHYAGLFGDSYRENWFQEYLQVKNNFMKMLTEIPGINHHTTWHDVESKVSSDPRCKALVSDSQREDLFKEYLKTVNDVKNNYMRSLSKIPDINKSTTWHDVKSKVTSDTHYDALFSDSHRENWFKEYLQVKNDFMKMLSEIPGINHHTTWSDIKSKVSSDSCYKAIVSDSREDLFREYLKIVNDVKNDFMKSLSKIPGINNSTTWSIVKSKVSSDSHYETLFSDSHRKNWFYEYLQVKNDFMKMLNEIPDINHHTNWTDVESKVSSDPRYNAVVGDSQENFFREYLKTVNDVKNDFMKRLSKLPGINECATWSNVKWTVTSDSRYAALFSDSHRENWFLEYLQGKKDFMKRMSELPGINHNTTWSGIKSKVSPDPSCEPLFSDSHRENWFQEYLKNLNDLKSDFIKMLIEMADITKCTTWTDVKNKVSSDPRYKAVVNDSYQEDWFMEYLKTVNDLKIDFMVRLSEVPSINNSTTWSDVKWKVNLDTDLRYKTYVSNSHQEDWFQEFLKNLNYVKCDFMKKLSEIPGICNSATWRDMKSKVSSDPQYKDLFSDSPQDNWFREYFEIQSEMKIDFMKNLSKIPGINDSTIWSDVKYKVSSDPQYVAFFNESHREDWFREYLKNLNDLKTDFIKCLSKIPHIKKGTTWRDVKWNVNSDILYKTYVSNSYLKDWFQEYLKNLQTVKNDFMKNLSKIPGICNKPPWQDVKSIVNSDPQYEDLFSDSHRQTWFTEYFQTLRDVKTDFMKKLSQIPGINHSTTWNDVKSKVSSDPCYEALLSDSQREDWFSEYLKNLNDVKNDFMKKLSEIPGINHSTTWSDVKNQVSSDAQCKALFSDSQLEDWFGEYLMNLNDVKNDFMKKLSEIPGINHSTTWSDVKNKVSSDPQCKALFSDSQREDWFGEYLMNLNDVKNDFMSRLNELPSINNSTTWSDVKTKMGSLPENNALLSDSHREDWLKEYLEILNDVKNDFMKKLSEVPGIKNSTTWSDVKTILDPYPDYEAFFGKSHLENWLQEYLKILNDVKNDFIKKLSEIPGIYMSTAWNDVKSKVCSDLQYESLFSDSHQRSWFMEYFKVKNDFMKRLSEIPGINHSTIWSDVKSQVSSDPRYEALVSDFHRENWFKEYLKKLNDAKDDFMKRLSKIPGINHNTTWTDVKSKVCLHPRYVALFSGPQREDWFREYLKVLNDKKEEKKHYPSLTEILESRKRQREEALRDFKQFIAEKVPECSFLTFKLICKRDYKLTIVITEQEMQQLYASHIDEVKKRKQEMVKDDFMKMLSEITDINLSITWSDVESKVSSDTRYKAVVSDSQRADLFREYLKILSDMKNDFTKQLSEIPDINLSTIWNDVKSKMSSDPRFEALISDCHREDWLKEYLKTQHDMVKNDFMKRLRAIRGINNSTTWSDVKSQMSSDPRYEALVSDSYREDWFREYLKNLNIVKNDFIKKLSEIPGIYISTAWSDVKRKVCSDLQNESLFSDTHQRSWFKEYFKILNDLEVKNDFMKRLSEIPGINHSTIWSDVKSQVSSDLRYEALVSDSHRENWFKEYLKKLNDAKDDFMKRLSKISGIDHNTTWSDVKTKVSLHPRNVALFSESQREDWFREYLKVLNDKKEEKKYYPSLMEILESRKRQREEALRDFKQFIAEKVPKCSFLTFKSICKRDYKLTIVITEQEIQQLYANHIDEVKKRKQEMVKDDFMKMLSEITDINLSITWSDVESKVSSDTRYKAVVSDSQRADLFREYLKILSDMKNDFTKQLSEIPDINLSTIWNDVKSKMSSDPRYEALVSDCHREDWLKEYLKTQHDMVKNDFMKRLREIHGINNSTTWSDVKSQMSSDPRYEALVSDSYREDWFREYLKNLNIMKNDFSKRLDTVAIINNSTTWSYLKIKLGSYPYYKDLFNISHGEDWFQEYLKSQEDVKNDFMKGLSKIPGINQSTTWKDVQSKVSSDPRFETLFSKSHRVNWFWEYLKNLNNVKTHFMKMLSEMPDINHSTTLSDVKSKVSSDPRYEAVVNDSHLEDWFREYLKNLNDLKNDFKKRLSEIPDINCSTTWSGMKSKVSLDPRYKAGVTDSQLEVWFQEYLKDLTDVKNEFMESLREIPDINQTTTWKDVKSKVSSDPRYKALFGDTHQENWFKEYLKNLNDVKNHFMKMLSVIPDINHSTTWIDVKTKVSSDPRYKTKVRDSHLEVWFREYLKNLNDLKTDFMKRLSEIPDINCSTTWSGMKSKVSLDPRYKAGVTDSHLEIWFQEYLKDLTNVKNEFMKSLREIPGINQTTTWKDVKSKVSSDPHYKALFGDSHQESWFKEYMKNLNDVKNHFMKTLSEMPDINHSTTWIDVKRKVSSDPRYKAGVRDSHLEVWFREYLKNLNYLKTDFMKRLSEIPDINCSTTWSGMKSKVSLDLRHKAGVTDSQLEIWFQEYLKDLTDVKNEFMKSLREIPGINQTTTWKDVKNKVSSNPRYKALFGNSHQENWFMEYLKNLNDVKNHFMKTLSEMPDINHSTTWIDVKRKVSSDPRYKAGVRDSHLEVWFREYLKNLNDLKSDFMKRLSEIPDINYSTTWSEMKNKVNLDPQYRAGVADSQIEIWFQEYLKDLTDVKNNFMKTLREMPDINHSTAWKDVKSKVSSDPRYKALFGDSHQENWFKEYLKNLNDVKDDFMKMLGEISDINHKTSWSDVEKEVSSDPRYKAVVHDSQREDWFREYLKRLYDMVKNDFMKKLSKIAGINCSTTLSDVKSQVISDPRYEAFVSDSDLEAWIQEYIKIVNDLKIDFMKRLSKIPDINYSTAWSGIKSKVSLDARYKARVTDSHLEVWFQEYLKDLNNVKNDFMKRLSKIPCINHSTTWKDVKSKVRSDQRYKALFCDSHRENWFREYLKNLNDVKDDFMKMLSVIPDINHSTSWGDMESKVSSDPRYKAVVHESQREDWFREYLTRMYDMVKNDFMKKLSEIPGINCSTTLSDVKIKVSSDPHYEAFVSDSHREDWIQEYVKIVNNMKKDFMKILSETPGINHRTTWSYIKRKVSSDPRYKALVNDSHREDWFKEYLKTLNDVKNDFMKKLCKIPVINSRTTWRDVKSKVSLDAPYEALFSNFHRENWLREYIAILNCVKKDFMKRLSEIPGINSSTTWTDVKSKVTSDPLHTDIVSDSHREDWFRKYLILNHATADDIKKTKSQDKQSQSSSLPKTLESRKSRVDASVLCFKEFLDAEIKANSGLSFPAFISLCQRHCIASTAIPFEEKKKLYYSHIQEHNRAIIWSLLDTTDISDINLWQNLRSRVKADPRTVSFTGYQWKREKKYAVSKHQRFLRAKEDFQELLKETKIITHKTMARVRVDNAHLKSIKESLKTDRRYTALSCIDPQREQMLLAYINNLSKKGPPPPPVSASAVTGRSGSTL